MTISGVVPGETTVAKRVARTAKNFSPGYRAWMLFLLCVLNGLNLADRQGLAATAPAIKLALRLSDTQLGLMQGLGFAIFYTAFGLPMARLAERWSRAKLISICVAVFGVMVALCGLANSFTMLLLARVGVGVGDAGFGPPVASLIGDHYPMQKRTSAMTVLWLGAPIGAMAGAMLGGWVAQNADWRLWYFGLGAPSLLIALVCFVTLREPIRGMSDPTGAAADEPTPSIGEVLRFLFAKRSMRHVLIGSALAAAAMNALGQFFARFIVGVFHLGYADAGRLLGIIAAIGMTSGFLVGGFGVEWAARRDRRWYAWGPALALVIATPVMVLGLIQSNVLATALILIAGHLFLFVYYTPTLALAQNMVSANMRASSAFVISLMLGLVGIGLGPTLIGILSDLFAHQAFHLGDFARMCPGGAAPKGSPAGLVQACGAASGSGIRGAIVVMSLGFAWAGMHYFLAARHLRQDLETRYSRMA